MGNNYNAIANIYDFLSRLIFQKSIINAQVFLLNHIPPNSKVLIAGGGTGWVLEELSKIHAEGIEITYVEKSEKMISLSKRKDIRQNKVEFINKSVEDFSIEKKYDIVFTAFLFDNFLPGKIEFVFAKLNQLLKPGGLWLYADFVNGNQGKLWQKLLLKTMYLFFKLTCNIETLQLTDMNKFFAEGYNNVVESFYYLNFIKAVAYTKNA